jgi:hypothetical protein
MLEPLPGSDYPGPAAAEAAPPAYRARLSRQDHFNSRGQPLRGAPDILRQDRANYHRNTHRDPEDTDDTLFRTAAARNRISALPVDFGSQPNAAARIVSGTPLVEVRITPTALQVTILGE